MLSHSKKRLELSHPFNVPVHTRNFILYEDVVPTHHVKWFTPCNHREDQTFSLCPAGFKDLSVKYDFLIGRLSVVNQSGSSLQYLPVNCRFENGNQTLIILYNGTEEKFEIGIGINK